MIRQRFRNLFTRKHARPNSRLESLPTRSARDHMADIDGPAAPMELTPRLQSGGPRSVPNGSAKTKKSRRHTSGHPVSNSRRSGHGKSHPAHRARKRAMAGRKSNVQRLIAAKK